MQSVKFCMEQRTVYMEKLNSNKILKREKKQGKKKTTKI